MKKWQLAVSSCFFGDPDENAFKICSEHGALLEVSEGDLAIAKRLDWEELGALSEKYGVDIWSYHMPFYPIDASAADEEVRKKNVEIFLELGKRAAEAGVKKFVFHPSGEPVPLDVEGRRHRMEQAKKSFSELAEIFDSFGGQVLIEDLPRSCLGHNSREIAEILSVDDRIGVIFDTNHLLEQDNIDFVREVGDKIVSTHFSDYDFIDERHYLPGEGRIDWPALMKALDEASYKGPILYEIGSLNFGKQPRKAPLTIEDLIKNREELVSFKAPTPHY